MGTALNQPQAEESHRYADGYVALRATLDGYSSQTVAKWLIEEGYWPRGKIASAAARVRACKDPDKDEHFRFSEIIFLCQKTGQHDAILFACEQVGREIPALANNPAAAVELLNGAIRAKERELDALRARRRVLCVQVDKELFPSPRGIRRLRFYLGRLGK